MHKLPFHGAHRAAVVLAFRSLLLEESLQVGVVLTGNEGGIVEQSAQCAIPPLREESFAVDGCTALVDATIEPEVGHELPRAIEAADIADVADEGSGTDRANPRNGSEERLRPGFRFSESSPHLLEILLQEQEKRREHTVELLLGGFLVDLMRMDEVLARGFELHQCCVLPEECLELQDCGSIGEAVAVARDEDRADRSCILHVCFDVAESCMNGFGGDVGIDDGDVPSVISEKDAEKKVVDAGGLQTDFCVFLLELPAV